MKRDRAAVDREKRQHRREIAVPDERLRRAPGKLAIEQRQHLCAAVAAAHADERGDVRILPRAAYRCGSHIRSAGKVALTREHRVIVHGHEPETPELFDAAVEFFAIERAGRRDDGDAIA